MSVQSWFNYRGGRVFLTAAIILTIAFPATAKTDEGKQRAFEQLAQAWGQFYAGQSQQAYKTVARLTKYPDTFIALCAAQCQARSLWTMDSSRPRQMAVKIWSSMGKKSSLNVVSDWTQIGQALQVEAKGDGAGDQAVRLLKKVFDRKLPDISAAEAGIELGWRYADQQKFDEAERAWQGVVRHLRRPEVKAELPDALLKPFSDKAQASLKQLKYLRNAGRKEFEAARRLEGDGKWSQAFRSYRNIVQDFPQTDYAPRSEVRIGYCFLGHGRADRAVRQWEDFIASAPAGPWRGQAYVGLIDTLLDTKLDLPLAGKYAESAQAALPKALAEEQARSKDNSSPLVPSWKNAAFDLHVRVGMVNFCRDKTDLAADAFAQARTLTTDKITIDRLDSLIAATRGGRPLIPADCQSANSNSQSTIALTLSMGMLYHLAGREEKALSCFTRVTGTTAQKGQPAERAMPGATPAQLAFATFGRGAVAQAQGQLDQANEHLKASMKIQPDGSWHDETLYRLATITEQQAEATHAKPADKDATPTGKLTTKQRKAKEKAEQDRLTALMDAKGQALPYWQELITRHPKSPRVEQAMYNAGVLLCELAEAAPAAQSEKAWKEAAFMLNRFCEFYPKSLWAGDAYVRQVSMATGRMFDMDMASTIAQQAVGWAKDITEGRGDLPEAPLLPAWCLLERYPTYASLRPTFYDCYQWAGLVAYLRQQQDQAVAFCRQADRFDDSLRSRSGGETSMVRMIAVVQGARDALTPEELLNALKDDKQKTGILLADLSLMTFDPERAGELYERLLTGGWPFPRPTPEVESYLFLRIGQALEFQRQHEEAIAYLKRLYDPKYAKYPWTADGIFRIGTWAYNATQDPNDAMKHWEYVFKRNPKHPEAERSLFYYGLTAMRTKEYRKAAEAFTEYLNRYPDSRWTKRVETELLPQAQKGIKENKG